ncbi:MAG: CvpA family protein [Oscillospiraceae bacterium]|jgi:uncharacterized membrane protein required for colicin V production|nr:CvpA family protein [Oscillospiraceae bacterium]
MIGVVIDIIILAFVAFCAYRGFRAGIVRGIAGFLALMLSLILANAASEAFSAEFTGVLRPFVGGLVDGRLQSILSPEKQESEEEREEERDDVLPDENEYDIETSHGLTMLTLRKLGFFKSAAEKITETIKTETVEAGYSLGSIITDKLCKVIARVAVFAAAFILLSIAFAVVGSLIGFVFSLPGLRQLDAIAGLAAGLLRGALIVLFAAAVLRYLGIVTADVVAETKLLRYIVDNNIIADVLGI